MISTPNLMLLFLDRLTCFLGGYQKNLDFISKSWCQLE